MTTTPSVNSSDIILRIAQMVLYIPRTGPIFRSEAKTLVTQAVVITQFIHECMEGMCRTKTTLSIFRNNSSMTFARWIGSGKGSSQKHKVQKLYSEMGLIIRKRYGIYTMTQFGIRRKPRWNSKQDRL